MRRPSGGYTLVEVLIFLAISSVLLAISIVVVRGQGGKTELRASANDVHTKLQQWIDQVENGFSGSTAQASQLASNYDCSLDASSYPRLTLGGGGAARGANPDCIFLGKALQVNDDPNSDNSHVIYAYTVIGRRTHTVDGNNVVVDSLLNAKPTAAYYPANNIDLTEEYTIPNGSHILSSKIAVLGQPSKLAGFFTDLNASDNSGSSSIRSVQYPLAGNNLPRDDDIINCIKLLAPCEPAGANPWPMSIWEICLANSRTEDRALITVQTANGRGASTNVNIGVGDDICS